MEARKTTLKVIHLLEPTLCFSCRFATFASVTMSDGLRQKMLHCKRLDCDNWAKGSSGKKPIRYSDER